MSFNVALANLLAKKGIPPTQAANATVQSVSITTSAQTALAANSNRRGASFYNDNAAGAASVYLKYGSGASSTDYKTKLDPGDYYETQLPIFTGLVSFVGTSEAGALRITELT